MASRICGAEHGGQILVSRAAQSALAGEIGVELRSLGKHRLRGIPDEQELFQAVAAGLLDDFAPLRLGGEISSG
jgi:class 3 adenylate cyclase